MLRLMNVEKLREHVYAVTLERDGKRLRYEFIWRPPPRPGLPDTLDYDEQVVWDLMAYEVKPPPGRPHGAITIPALDEVCQIVYRVADGGEVDFPVVLDER